MFTFMPHIMAKFTKYMVRTFLVENPDTGQKYSFCNSEIFLNLGLWVFGRFGVLLNHIAPLQIGYPVK